MKLHLVITVAVLFSIIHVKAQTIEVYAGTMNDNTPISMYLLAEENECTADTMYRGMYKYDDKSKWLQLDITTDNKTQFVLVEYEFTGVLILEKSGDRLNGIWISPDSKRQLNVELHRIEVSDKKKEALEKEYEEVNYENYDC